MKIHKELFEDVITTFDESSSTLQLNNLTLNKLMHFVCKLFINCKQNSEVSYDDFHLINNNLQMIQRKYEMGSVLNQRNAVTIKENINRIVGNAEDGGSEDDIQLIFPQSKRALKPCTTDIIILEATMLVIKNS
jgi:hypothetical protein